MSSNTRWNKAEKAVQKHFHDKMPKRVQKALAYVLTDLYEGPMETYGPAHIKAQGFPSTWTFHKASKIVKEWAEDNLRGEIYYDSQSGYVSESAPEDWVNEETGELIEPYWEDWFEFDSGALQKAVLGAEVAKVI